MSKIIKVLLIDDEPDFTKPMAFWLQSKGYAVISADNAESGIKMVKEEAPDIIFLDLNMPVVDGIVALKRIRGFNKNVPVVVISAYVDRLRLTEARTYGISGVFYKGEDFDQSLALIESVLKRHKNLKDK